MRIVYALLVNLVLLLLHPLRLLRRKFAAPRGAWLRVDLDGGVTEVPRKVPFWDRRPQPMPLTRLRRLIEEASSDPRVRGLVFVLKRLAAGTATATALRDALLSAKQRGLRLVVYLPEGGGTRELYVATAGDLILVGPETEIAPLGFAVQSHYLKNALDKAGIEPEVFARGQYKTAGEPLVSDHMSDAQREQLSAVLDTAWEALIEAIVSGRGATREVAERWVNEGPWTAANAVHQGLCNALVYEDGLAEKLEPRQKAPQLIYGGSYLRRRELSFKRFWPAPYIAVIEVAGPIVSRDSPLPVPVASQDSIVKAIDRARESRRVRGVVVQINSPGGSALASERMLHALKRLAKDKPVVAQMEDLAASGGYMLAVGAPVIVAQPTTITGSIGVVAARLVIGPLLDKLGIAVEVVKRGARADMHSPARHLSEDEHAALSRQLEEIYQGFVRVVAEGRGRGHDEIDALAGGRVWSGRDAQRHGLVDKLGGFDVALAEVRARIGAGAQFLRPEILSSEKLRPPLPFLRLLSAQSRWAESVAQVSSALGADAFAERLALMLSAPRERALLWSNVAEL